MNNLYRYGSKVRHKYLLFFLLLLAPTAPAKVLSNLSKFPVKILNSTEKVGLELLDIEKLHYFQDNEFNTVSYVVLELG